MILEHRKLSYIHWFHLRVLSLAWIKSRTGRIFI